MSYIGIIHIFFRYGKVVWTSVPIPSVWTQPWCTQGNPGLIWTHCLDLGVVRGCTVRVCVNNNMQEHTSCCQHPFPSLCNELLRSPSHMSDLCSGPSGSPHHIHSEPWWLFAEGFSLTPHILSLQWGQRNVSQMTDVEEVCWRGKNDHTCKEGFELSVIFSKNSMQL